MKELTEPMLKALKLMDNVYGYSGSGHRFNTLEALRHRGLAARYTVKAIGADYVEKDVSTVQYRAPAKKPHLIHDWYITTEGKNVLRGVPG
jgi:hypothetical protein